MVKKIRSEDDIQQKFKSRLSFIVIVAIAIVVSVFIVAFTYQICIDSDYRLKNLDYVISNIGSILSYLMGCLGIFILGKTIDKDKQ